MPTRIAGGLHVCRIQKQGDEQVQRDGRPRAGVVLRYTLPHTPKLNPIEPQWAAIKGGVGGTYFGDFGSMQICIKKALENGEITVVRLQEYMTDPASPRGDTGVEVICTA